MLENIGADGAVKDALGNLSSLGVVANHRPASPIHPRSQNHDYNVSCIEFSGYGWQLIPGAVRRL